MLGVTVSKSIALLFLLAWLTAGCAATYVPISWDMGERVQQMTRSDQTLAILFDRYDPARSTLRVAGESFDEVMMPPEVKYHLGAYRPDTQLIYRNLYQEYSDDDLRDLMVHEFSHHIWFNFMSREQREKWGEHLANNPTPLQDMVRRVYHNPADYGIEDFAFTVEYARRVDIEELARLNLLSAKERDAIVAQLRPLHRQVPLQYGSRPATPSPVPASAALGNPY